MEKQAGGVRRLRRRRRRPRGRAAAAQRDRIADGADPRSRAHPLPGLSGGGQRGQEARRSASPQPERKGHAGSAGLVDGRAQSGAGQRRAASRVTTALNARISYRIRLISSVLLTSGRVSPHDSQFPSPRAKRGGGGAGGGGGWQQRPQAEQPKKK